MRRFIYFFIFSALLAGCRPSSTLKKDFSCPRSSALTNTETVLDFKENFSVELPRSWKTSLYYDDYKSEIFSADTTQVFQNAYVLEFGLFNGTVQINPDFQKKVHEKTLEKQLVLVKDKFADFHKHKGYYHLGKGFDKGTQITVFQYYIQVSNTQYLLAKSEIYGTEQVDERLCESIELINSIQFIPPDK